MRVMGKTVAKIVAIFMVLTVAGFVMDRSEFSWALSRGAYRSDEQKVKQAVESFNRYLMDVYASGGSGKAIDEIPATKGMRHRIFKDAGYLNFGKKILVYDLASLEIDSVKLTGPRTAEATTREEWNYQYKQDKTYREIGKVWGGEGAYRYLLVKERGVWLVQRYIPLKQEKRE
jgi:hypothetical protein